MTPDQEVRLAAERDPSPTYADGRPKQHRHTFEYDVHDDATCTRPGTRHRVYVFDAEDLDMHEEFIAQRAADEATTTWARVLKAVRRRAVRGGV